MSAQYRRRVGAVRPSHLMFTSGVGSLVDLPNFSVLLLGLDDWTHDGIPDWEPIAEPRLLAGVQALPGNKHVVQLRPAPWLAGLDADPRGPASRIGVPTTPFPAWLRCTACNELAPLATQVVFGFENDKPRRPHDARFFHDACGRKKSGKKPLAVPARFVLACTAGHLDEFPYPHFVHRGDQCPKASHQPTLQMEDRGGNIGANVEIRCVSCGERRNMREAMGARGTSTLPRCRGRHPQLATFDPDGCDRSPKVLVIGASNQWFAQTLSALAVPRTAANELESTVERYWEQVSGLPTEMYAYGRQNVPAFRELARWTDDEISAAVEVIRARSDGAEEDKSAGYPDLRTPEWEIFSATEPPVTDEFALRRDPDGVPAPLKGVFADVAQAERLREVRALVGFTRLDAPDPDDPELVTRAPLTRSDPKWVPASEVRGEGIFLRVPEVLLSEWEARVAESDALRCHRDAYGHFRENRYSDRIAGPFDPMKHWPGARYIALHTLSHLLIRTIALDCGYSCASLSERIYAGTEDDPRSGILIYTAHRLGHRRDGVERPQQPCGSGPGDRAGTHRAHLRG